MKKPTPSLTPTAKRLIAEFEDASGDYYWQQDQGGGLAVTHAETRIKTAKAELEAFVLKLQQKAKK